MSERLFTIEEANSLVPRLTQLLGRIGELHARLAERGAMAGVSQVVAGNGSPARASELAQDHDAYVAAVTEITEMGIVLRDPRSGLVDFPALRDGEEVYLCWRLGEAEVGHWHDRTTGFAGRRPL